MFCSVRGNEFSPQYDDLGSPTVQEGGSAQNAVVGAAVVITGQPEEARDREDQQRGRKRQPSRPGRRSRPEPAVRRIAEDLRRIERGEVRSERVVFPLKRRPGGVQDEGRESEENRQRLHPPEVPPHRVAERTPSDQGRCTRHGHHLPTQANESERCVPGLAARVYMRAIR
jgi:hypothetical protein